MKLLSILILSAVTLSASAAPNTSSKSVTKTKPFLNKSQKDTWKWLTGTWYGSQPVKGGGKKQWITRRTRDGKYTVTFRYHKTDGTYEDKVETGLWGVSGPIYFAIFQGWVYGDTVKHADPADPYNYDAYKIITLTDKKLVYQAYASGNRYTSKKVPDSFTFPK